MDVVSVDFGRVCNADRPGERPGGDEDVQALARRRGQELGIGQTGDVPGGVEHHRPGHDGAGQAAAPHFVHPGDEAEAVSPVVVLDRAPGTRFRHDPARGGA
jgi:hypothetical protein